MRYLLAAVLALPGAALFGVNGGFLVGWGAAHEAVVLGAGALSWLLVTYMAGRERRVRRVFGRTAVAAAIAAFALPASVAMGALIVGSDLVRSEDYEPSRVTWGFGAALVGFALVGIAAVVGVLIGGASALVGYLALKQPR